LVSLRPGVSGVESGLKVAVLQVELGEEPLDGCRLAETDHVVVRPRDVAAEAILDGLGVVHVQH
jgi:hypothetical protein